MFCKQFHFAKISSHSQATRLRSWIKGVVSLSLFKNSKCRLAMVDSWEEIRSEFEVWRGKANICLRLEQCLPVKDGFNRFEAADGHSIGWAVAYCICCQLSSKLARNFDYFWLLKNREDRVLKGFKTTKSFMESQLVQKAADEFHKIIAFEFFA